MTLSVDHADAMDWLSAYQGRNATCLIFDPPYAVGSPVRGREDGAAGSVFGPLSFMSKTLAMSAKCLRSGGIAAIFADWRRMPDLAYVATTVGLRASTCISWTRNRPGTGGLFRSAWDPILIVSRGTPDAVDRAAIRNVIHADYPTKRRHPYEKPKGVYSHIYQRICRPGDLVLDPFAGSANSGRAAVEMGLHWKGCDIDPNYCGALTEDSK